MINEKNELKFERNWMPPSHWFKKNLYETIFDVNYIIKEILQ